MRGGRPLRENMCYVIGSLDVMGMQGYLVADEGTYQTFGYCVMELLFEQAK